MRSQASRPMAHWISLIFLAQISQPATDSLGVQDFLVCHGSRVQRFVLRHLGIWNVAVFLHPFFFGQSDQSGYCTSSALLCGYLLWGNKKIGKLSFANLANDFNLGESMVNGWVGLVMNQQTMIWGPKTHSCQGLVSFEFVTQNTWLRSKSQNNSKHDFDSKPVANC